MHLIIDVGNTRVKTAVFRDNKIVKTTVFLKAEIVIATRMMVANYKIVSGIISSVAKISKKELDELHKIIDITELNHTTKIPFKNLYKTPKTLGVDRIALVSAGIQEYPNKNVLIIDAGTCVTFDFISEEKEYFGGAISPGLKMRYKALHQFTANLPLLKKQEKIPIIGGTTDESIHSGVLNGLCNEIDGVINQYKAIFKDLTVVLTGGDSNFLLKQLKNRIFAHSNFILEGLYTILIYNKTND